MGFSLFEPVQCLAKSLQIFSMLSFSYASQRRRVISNLRVLRTKSYALQVFSYLVTERASVVYRFWFNVFLSLYLYIHSYTYISILYISPNCACVLLIAGNTSLKSTAHRLSNFRLNHSHIPSKKQRNMNFVDKISE